MDCTANFDEDYYYVTISDDILSIVDIPMEELPIEGSDLKEKATFQKEVPFNKLLPYSDKLDNEADALLAKIKANLGRCVMLRDINPGCVFWTNILHKYIMLYDLRFTKEEHISLIKLMYELITIPNIESSLINVFATQLCMLLRKNDLISPEELELPWQPLYNLYLRTITHKQLKVYFYHVPQSVNSLMKSLVYIVKIYFPVSATQEILSELRPKICPFDPHTMQETMRSFELFLPVQLAREYHSQSYDLWLHEFMKLWENCNINLFTWCKSMMQLISRLAFNNIGYINWEPYLPLMFTRFVQSFNLPVCYKKLKYNSNCVMEPSSIGLWIAAVLGNESSAQKYLEKFLKTIETYYHPANQGLWIKKLGDLFLSITYFVILRINRERYRTKPTWKSPIPESQKLTDADIDAFVNSMMPIAMIGIFNKQCSNVFYDTLHYLATMRPNIVIPMVLEKVHPNIGSDIEPHKHITAMTCMITIARPLIQGSRISYKEHAFEEGPLYVLPLLFASLSGIDPNDLNKCYVTFRLISTYATMIPIVDCSKCSVELSEEDRQLCEETSRFEDFVLQFMDKVFVWINSSSVEFVRLENQSSDNGKSRTEAIAENMLSQVFLALLKQTSHSIFLSALNKLRCFIVEHMLETRVAGQLVAVLCKVFSNVNSHETLKALLPFLSEKVLDAIGEEDDVIKAENLDNNLLYPLLLLNRLVFTRGDALLPYMDTLIKLIDKTIRLRSREGNRLGCFTLNNVMQSLSNISSVNIERNLNDPDYPFIKEWGEPVKIKSTKIKMYTPGEEELAILQKMFIRYFIPFMEEIENFIKKENSLSRDDLQITLRIIFNILNGCDSVLPFWEEAPLKIKPYDNCIEPMNPEIGIQGEIKMPDGSNVRYYVVRKMMELQEIMMKNIEDDTQSLNILTLIWLNLLLGHLRMSMNTSFKITAKYCISKKVVENKMTGSNGWFPFLVVERVDFQHNMRKLCTTPVFTKTHENILISLFKLSTSQYSKVRKTAQEIIQAALGYFPNAYISLKPHIVDYLKKDPTIHHGAYKGILYLITRKVQQHQEPLLVKQDWKFIKSLWPALVLSEPSEKLSVIRLKEFIFDLATETFYTMNIKLEVPDICISAAEKLWDVGIKPSGLKPSKEEVKKGIEKLQESGESNLKTYNEILDQLLNVLLKKNLHWRNRLMAMNFFYVLLHPEQIFPPQVVRYFLESLIHDSIKERKVAVQVLIFIFKQLKRKHTKMKIDPPIDNKSSINSSTFKIQPGCRTDNTWLQYNYNSRPISSAEWDEPRYVHKSNVGCYAWPSQIEIYAPSSKQPSFDKCNLTDQEKEIEQFFKNQQNVDKFIRFFSLEGKKGRDKFGNKRFLFFKGLFRNHGDAFLENFLPHLNKLVMDKQESSQRCAAEIICGIIKGAKHWPYDMTESMWTSLLPVIRSALSNLTTETIHNWGICICNATKDRDPNRLHWLLECLMEESPLGQSEASFVECGRLVILQAALSFQSWRVRELLQRLLLRFENRLEESPFQNVRDRLASTLVCIFHTNIKFSPTITNGQSFPEVTDFINKVYPRMKSLIEENESSKFLATCVENIDLESNESLQLSSNLTPSNSCSIDIEREKNVKLFITICRWITETVINSNLDSLSSFYKIFPIMCHLENNDKDEDLSKTCSMAIAVLARTLTPPEHLPAVLTAVRNVSQSVSWSARMSSLEFLQILVFHNMSILLSNESWILSVQDIVLMLMEDERLEVREKAAQVLGGLLHCTIIPDQEALLNDFKKKAKTKLKKKKLPDDKTEETRKAKMYNATLLRHTGVLGMCAFIQAHPYDVPKHIPPIFECLSFHLNDPEPIPSTIRKTLNDFKRTHCDGWTGLRGLANFTEEQLAIMQDLTMPPSYYA